MRDSRDLGEKFKCDIADELKAAVGNRSRTLEDSPYKDYLYELLQSNDPFNQYITKYDKTNGIFLKVVLCILGLNVLISFIFSKVDPQTDFVTFVTGIEVTTIFIACFVGTIMSLYEKGKAMRHYIPIIKDNMICLENELKSSSCTQERRQYIAAVHYLCSYIYTSDKYRFDHYKK